MEITHYGVQQNTLKLYRARYLMRTRDNREEPAAVFGYLMAQLAQTYRTRKVMYDNNVAPLYRLRLSDDRTILPKGPA